MKRVITENGKDGKSRILVEEALQPYQLIWETNAERWLGFEPAARADMLDFRAGHTVVRQLEIPPESVMAEYLKAGVPGLDANGFHRTGTLDYLILIEGRLRLDLDEGSVELSSGDIVVQRDTNHAWRNPDDTPAKCLVFTSRPKEA